MCTNLGEINALCNVCSCGDDDDDDGNAQRDFNHKVAEMEKLQHDKVAAVEASYAAMQV